MNKDVEVPLQKPRNPSKTSEDINEPYDPHLYREVENPTTDLQTLVHLLKCSLGTGILAMPQGFLRAGMVGGVIGTVLLGILTTYCLHLLIKITYELCIKAKTPLIPYPKALERALELGPAPFKKCSRFAPGTVDSFLVLYQSGICCVYTIFVADNIKAMVDPYWNVSIRVHIVIVAIPLLGLSCIRGLRSLAPLSAAANVLTLLGLAAIVYYVTANEPISNEIRLVGDVNGFSLFLGTTLFALTAVGVVVSLENNMATPKSFGTPCGVLNRGMGVVVGLYVLVGGLGYAFCGNRCRDSITLDLPQDTALGICVKTAMTIAILISYTIQGYVPVEVLWRSCVEKWLISRNVQNMLAAEYALRISLCIISVLIAVAVPRLGDFISLLGALCLSTLGIIFPAIMKICLLYSEDKKGIHLILPILLVIVGIIAFFAGTYAALVNIVKSYITETAGITETLSNLATNTHLKYVIGSEENYEPFKHRQVPKPSNNWHTLANVIKSSFGAGILAMPQAFVYAGMFGGIVGTIIISFLEAFKATCHFGPKCMRCMEKHADCIADIFIFVLQQGLLIVYSIFCGTTVKAVCDGILDPYPLRAYILVCGIPLILLACIRSLRHMAPISMFANVMTIIAVLVIVIYSLATEPLNVKMEVVGDFMKYQLFFGIVMFALNNIGIVMSIENDMEHPEDFMKPLGIFNIGMTIVVAVYLLMGICGYYFCRTLCKGTITENMPQNYIGTTVQVTVALSIFISYMLNNYVVVEIGWGHWIQPCMRRRWNYDENDSLKRYEYMCRIINSILTVLIAFAVPSLGDIISLIGAFCVSILAVFCPTLAYITYVRMKKTMNVFRCLLILFLIIVSIAVFTTGTVTSLDNIIRNYKFE